MSKTMALQRKIILLEKKLLRERRLNSALRREMVRSCTSLLEPLGKLTDILQRHPGNIHPDNFSGNDSCNHQSKNLNNEN